MRSIRLDVFRLRPTADRAAVDAWIVGRSERCRDGRPEVVFVMKLRLPPGASAQQARDLALEYLDPA
ncbi:MAG: hypothetical protein IT337_07805 [Thermomicrobiales bacterium]|nr:hypothetical protein [Thermomicrobiales bacterium]